MKHLADQGPFTAAAQLKATPAARRLLAGQPGYNKGATMRVAKTTTGAYRLYVAVQGQWMDGSLKDLQIKPGRPELPPGEARTARLSMRTLPEIEAKAKRVGTEAVEAAIRRIKEPAR